MAHHRRVHAVLQALVIVIVRARIAGMDRSLIEASWTLCGPVGDFRQVTLPQLMPAILAGFPPASSSIADDGSHLPQAVNCRSTFLPICAASRRTPSAPS
jgi:hypothetical protein